MVTNNQIIESDGKRFRVQLIEIVPPTYEHAGEAGFYLNEKDIESRHAYIKLKTLQHFYNGGEKGKLGIYFTSAGSFYPVSFRQIFNFKDRETADKFIKEQKELLTIFYQL
jgi:hypothetical protein